MATLIADAAATPAATARMPAPPPSGIWSTRYAPCPGRLASGPPAGRSDPRLTVSSASATPDRSATRTAPVWRWTV